jgi:8-oxo-dGTP diphosphatase
MSNASIRSEIRDIVSKILPHDDIEKDHIHDALHWIDSGAGLFRIRKPDLPNKHLVSYFVLFDEKYQKILLVDHKKAQVWLPTGGHVDPNEHPKDAAARECQEELYIAADFWLTEPLFLTQLVTFGLVPGHTDVSLWYVLKGDSTKMYAYDPDEFNGIQWFGLDEVNTKKTDPHLSRFVEKLKDTCALRTAA